MPLPKLATPTYELELPSTRKPIHYRPFLVKEEKLLVLALESENTKEITTAIKNVIKSCIKTRGIKVENLPTFDIEFLFLNIRGKSVGEDIEVNLICPDDKKTQVPVTINIDDVGVGGGVTDVLLEAKYPVNGINVGEKTEKGISADDQGKIRFINKRAYYYWKLAQAFRNGLIDIDDEELAKELMHIKRKHRSDGLIQIIEKGL